MTKNSNQGGPALNYTFQDFSSYHSNAVSEVAAASHARRWIEREIDQLGHFKRLQRSHFLSDSKTKHPRLDNEETFFVVIR